jgi:hypothetical protein
VKQTVGNNGTSEGCKGIEQSGHAVVRMEALGCVGTSRLLVKAGQNLFTMTSLVMRMIMNLF